jgi:copper chaperone NosL
MKSFLSSLLGPELFVELPDGTKHSLNEYLIPNAIFMVAALLLAASTFFPYWRMNMTAPQYPKGLYVNVYVNHLEGDMREIDALNHYLGMPELDEGGRLERSLSLFAIVALGLLLAASVFVHNQLAALFALPVIAYPFIFVADLWYILYTYGHSIDPQSALGGAIKPFTPPIVGEGKVGQFGTSASFENGFYLAVAAVIVVLIGLYFHRRAYKPVVDARKRLAAGRAAAQSNALKVNT